MLPTGYPFPSRALPQLPGSLGSPSASPRRDKYGYGPYLKIWHTVKVDFTLGVLSKIRSVEHRLEPYSA